MQITKDSYAPGGRNAAQKAADEKRLDRAQAYVNLTPHPINYQLPSGAGGCVIPPSGKRATILERPDRIIDGVQTYVVDHVIDLPDPDGEHVYIVSKPVALAAQDRDDVVFPDKLLRDEAGRVIGCGGFGRYVADYDSEDMD